jgi:hypothetical protein
MGYAILRAKKLKSFGAVARSARHTHREQPTPNADPAMTGQNRTVGAKGTGQVLAALKRSLPTKRRKDAVLAIEYLVTASPEDFKRHGGHLDDTGNGYFADALKWLQQKHGKENVISATIHLDESTPHLVVYVVPMTADKRLSCRDFFGVPEKMRAMQTDFHAKCGASRGLERGVEGSKAKHEAVSAFYATMTASDEAPALKPKDYAAAAVGVKTEAWKQAEDVAKANATKAVREPRTKKATRAKAKAAEKQAEALEQKAQSLSHKEINLCGAEDDLERRYRSLSEREKEVSAAEHKILALEAEREALERRLELLQGKPEWHEKAPRKGLGHDESATLG